MEYIYDLNKNAKKKFKFDTMVCNGWFGVYSEFNKYIKERKEGKFTYYDKIDIKLSDDDIDYIIKNSKSSEC